MNAIRSARVAALAICLTVVAAACSSPEDDLRAEMLADGLSESSVDCVMSAFEEAGVDLDNLDDLDDLDDLPPGAEFAMAGCLEEIFGEMFAEGFDELGAELAEGFEDFDSDGAMAFSDSGGADLDELVDSCQAGDNAACDDLWLASPFDSEEERIAESCGGRSSEERMGTCEFWLD